MLGADWQDFVQHGTVTAEELRATLEAHPVPEEPEDEEEDPRPLCECCGEPFAELDDEDLCDQCAEETRLDREHIRFESRSSLFI